MDVVHREDTLVVPMLVVDPLMKYHANHLIGGQVDMVSIFREGNVDPGVDVQFPVVFGPSAVHQGGALNVEDQAPRGAIEELSSSFVCPL